MSGRGHHALDLTGPAGDPASPVHRLDPRAKTVALVGVTVIAVSTPLRAWPAYVACAGALVAVAAVGRVGPREVWRRARIVLPVVLLAAAFLPLVRRGGATFAAGPLTLHEAGLATFTAVAAKATLGTCSAILLAATTPVPEILRALEAFRLPRLLVLIAGVMARYLSVVVQEGARMRAALVSRAYAPRHALQAGALGGVATAMFLRTYTRGERVHRAMLARGYDGSIPHLDPLRMRRADVVFLALIAVLVPVRVAAGVGA